MLVLWVFAVYFDMSRLSRLGLWVFDVLRIALVVYFNLAGFVVGMCF